MGTTWSLRFDNPHMLPLDTVRAAMEAALARVVAQMSHWQTDSDLSRYNRAAAGAVHALASGFATVLACALRWAEASGGALDPTVGPLVALWGFGPEAADDVHPPAPEALRAAHAACGWQRLPFDAVAGTLRQPGGLTLDFSGIAKGFAVDHVVEGLRALGLKDLLLEIGGELRGVGRRPGGASWTVQIAAPEDGGTASPTVALADLAVATSGDRWHRREHAGRRWSHTIDPRTGEPVGHALASVTVLHAECMQADALATALTVLGPAEGLAFARAHDIAALFFERKTDGLQASASPAWMERVGA
ncbi:FAD:protein FMN transferase [Variovorax sp. J22G21]|uniref:FAD:protein FMN transferase n=1 Tax=Variovorax fucosicus TaxID=3053517 RepID=UPI00257876D7|nr:MULTISPECIES: FAD:protein FMN transferase [unclassified Variovorax]MDM0040597.1 FAD:protein FMN transferase [Variovorax sp. J22R193]MDM0061970.1 FAD:protein FMN transferase [Variovorax sp. J22G21]